MHVSGQLDPGEFHERLEHMFDRTRESFGAMPVWAPANWAGKIALGEWILHGGPHSLSFRTDAGGRLEIRTSLSDPRRDVAVLFQRESAASGGFSPLETFEAPSPDRLVDISVDGSPEPFEVWDGDGVTRAAASVHGHALTLEAQDIAIDELELVAVRDLEPFIAGTREWIHTLRGES